ncbi:MAG: SPOR domain-containing protein [Bacteroidales bacterium]
MTIANYICDLICEHDCVIIPELGAFVSTNSSAKVHCFDNSFTPPGRKIRFNEQLHHKDNLLVNYICEQENVSVEIAQFRISYFVKGVKASLDRGDVVEISGLGCLHPKEDNEIQFSLHKGCNLNLDSFGFDEFISPIITRGFGEEGKADNISRILGNPNFDGRLKKYRSNIGVAATYALRVASIVLLIVFFGSVLFVSQPREQRSYSNFASLFSLNGQLPVSFIKMSEKLKDVEEDSSKLEDELANKSSSVHLLASGPILNPEGEQNHNYYLVAASFKGKRKAMMVAHNLKSKGYDSKVVSPGKKGPFRVSYAYVKGKFNALKLLAKIRNLENPSAWMLIDK